MLYQTFRILRAIDRSYALCVFWLYVAMFVLTFALVFVFPPGALAMIFLALAGLLVAVTIGKLLMLTRAGIGRLLVRSGVCPGCAFRRLPAPPTHPWRCEQCERIFLATGTEVSADAP